MNTLPKLIIILALATSCKKAGQPEMEPARLFRPISFAAAVDGVTVNFSWIPIKDASYSLEISQDSLRFEHELRVIPIAEASAYTVHDLWGSTRYSARIKSVSANPATADSEYATVTFVTQVENIFYATAADDITANQITLKWDSLREVSHLTVSTAGASDITVGLTEEEQAAGQKTISGLQENTSYTFRVYLNERSRGIATITTTPANP